jgi:acetyl-CoA carboxylase beta subunit
MDIRTFPCPDCKQTGTARKSYKDNENKGKFWMKCQNCNVFSWFKEGQEQQLELQPITKTSFPTAFKPDRNIKDVMDQLCILKSETADLAEKVAKLEARLDQFDREVAKRQKV